MSFVTTRPEALTAATSALQSLGSSMAAQNAAAGAPTTDVAPAAADEVSTLQATQFAAYGAWYQQVSALTAAIHERLVSTLGVSAGSYGETEAANQTATSSTPLAGLFGSLTGASTSTSPTGALDFGINGTQNFTAAASDMLSLAQGQFLPSAGTGPSATADLTGGLSASTAPAAGSGGVPQFSGSAQAAALGGSSAPPSWASGDVASVGSRPAMPAATDWASAAPQVAPVTALPAGVPSTASAARRGIGLGAPRYGVKPTVMPKPTVD